MNPPAWYYQKGDEVVGPVTPDQLKQAAVQGLIKANTWVRQENGDWLVASSINGLAQLLTPKASPTPTPAAQGTAQDREPEGRGQDADYEVLDSVTRPSLKIEVLGYKQLRGSQNPYTATNLFFANQAGLQLKQIKVTLNNGQIITEAGALHYLQGAIEATSSVGGAAGLGKAFLKSLTTQESIFTPKYEGTGEIYLEPSFGFYLIHELHNEQIIADKDLFYCGSASLEVSMVAQRNLSSAVLGGEGLFQVSIKGSGLCVFEIPVPATELRRVDLHNDVLKVDGNFALMRTGDVSFTVEKSTKGLLGSMTSGEGLLQTFRGTGTVWLAPTQAIYQRISMGGLSGMTSAQLSSGTRT
ncbi:MAG: AIM24 family protein [Leptolyngbyaceae bacterium]|nr:AIM24 family protein [Leptolyngbyaceae bacterium]